MSLRTKKMPSSFRKHIRKEKARIRRQVLDSKKQESLIDELYLKFEPKKKSEQARVQKSEQQRELKSKLREKPREKKEKLKQKTVGKKEKLKNRKEKDENK